MVVVRVENVVWSCFTFLSELVGCGVNEMKVMDKSKQSCQMHIVDANAP